ncbi:DUF4383 domain-containing protein [Pseudonocardia sp. D17]|uniref:DUF4383 domain-containing protein n=1 Tax=Pseudonocardia sp. D17 TaxID=882661 RepID=UPI002B38DDC9|nr:hypothetical protein PSD17_36990 [Pseudonocardia sp. D17]
MAESTTQRTGPAPVLWIQIGALVLGTLMFLYGLVGFWPSFAPAGPDGQQSTLLGIECNALRCALQVLLGVIGWAAASRAPAARGYGWLLAVVNAVFVVLGIIGVANPDADPLAMNVPAVVVAGAFALLGLVLALVPLRRQIPGGDDVLAED